MTTRRTILFLPRWILVPALLGVVLCAFRAPLIGQDPTNADEVLAKYREEIGGSERIASITTFVEKGELSGNLSGFGQPFAPPNPNKEHGTFEFYYKSPNLKFNSLTSNGQILGVSGCDGSASWYVNRAGERGSHKPKPGREYECKAGYEPLPLLTRSPSLKLKLKGKKKVEGRMAWAIEVSDPKSADTSTYYFDAETYLLSRAETVPAVVSFRTEPRTDWRYSDYRDVAGIKLPFMIVQRSENSSLVTVLRDVEINVPLDNERFKEPAVQKATKSSPARIDLPAASAPSVPAPPSEKGEAPVGMPVETRAAPAPELTYLNTGNFVSAPLAEVEEFVPELRGLKVAEDQQQLVALLEKVGDKTADLFQKIPNLICHEDVVESGSGVNKTRESFSYLILVRRTRDARTLEEFRVDTQTGVMLETDDKGKLGEPALSGPPTQLNNLPATRRASAGTPPLSQGFASMWLRFYPGNRSESTFRYLGTQKIDKHRTFVLAFAQVPGSVHLPGEMRFRDKVVPVFYQGIAWVDASDFRIVRLRQDLLPTTSDLAGTELTAEVHFAETQAGGFASPLWLAREVEVTSRVNGVVFHNKHTYSRYRSFQAHARIVLPD